jgi:hypothetical protein
MERRELIVRFLLKKITEQFGDEGKGKIKEFEAILQDGIEDFIEKVTEEKLPWWKVVDVEIFAELLSIVHLDDPAEQSIHLVQLVVAIAKDIEKYLTEQVGESDPITLA